MNVMGLGSFVIKEKLNAMKQESKVWNKKSFGNIEDNINLVIADIKEIDDKGK